MAAVGWDSSKVRRLRLASILTTLPRWVARLQISLLPFSLAQDLSPPKQVVFLAGKSHRLETLCLGHHLRKQEGSRINSFPMELAKILILQTQIRLPRQALAFLVNQLQINQQVVCLVQLVLLEVPRSCLQEQFNSPQQFNLQQTHRSRVKLYLNKIL